MGVDAPGAGVESPHRLHVLRRIPGGPRSREASGYGSPELRALAPATAVDESQFGCGPLLHPGARQLADLVELGGVEDAGLAARAEQGRRSAAWRRQSFRQLLDFLLPGASGNDGNRIAGVCWSANIMAVRVLDIEGNGSTADIVSGIHFAINNGANLALDTYEKNQLTTKKPVGS